MTDEVVKVSFVGDANFSSVAKQAKLLQAQFEAIKKSQADINVDAAWTNMQSNIAKSNNLTQLYSKQVTSSSGALSKAISDQTLTFKQAWQQRKLFNSVVKEQIALQKSLATITVDEKGVKTLQMWGVESNKLGDAAVTTRAKMGTLSAALKASSKNMVNWGKNTQWAGRQMMVGLGVPIAALGVATGVLANQTDKAFTRIAKVYGSATSGAVVDFAKLRAEGTKTMQESARQFGMAAKDTLSIQADLAAAGRTGQALQKDTLLVARAMTLGEVDQQEAMKGTIALQSVYRMSTKQLADAFNYMNSVENATNLSFADFIEAIPRGAGVLQKMGVTLRDLGPLLVAVKQTGMDVAQGMRGISSGAQSLLKIAPQTEKLYESLTGKSLTEEVIKRQGNFVKIINDMSDAMKGLEPYQRQQLITQIFGKFRSPQMTSVFDSLIKKTQQVSAAFDVSTQSTQQWANTAQSELNRFQQSSSGKFKIAVESLKNALLPIGNVFLQIATVGAKAFTTVAKIFNGMPTWTKWVIAFGAGFTALIGVLTMVTGVVANLLGHAVDLVAFMMGKWARGHKFMTNEQKAAALQLQETTDGVLKQTGAITSEAEAFDMLTKAMQRYLVSLGAINGGPVTTSNASERAIQNMIDSGGTTMPYVPRHAKQSAVDLSGEMSQEADATARSMADAEKRSKNVRMNMLGAAGAAAQLGVGVLAINNMAKGSHSLMDNVLNISLLLGSVGPLVGRGLAKIPWSRVTTGLTGALQNRKVITGAAGVASKVGSAIKTGVMAAMASPWTGVILAGLAAVAVGVYAIKKHQEAVLNEQSSINDKTAEWAKSLGGTEKSVINIATGMHKTKQDMDATNFAKQVSDVTKANSQLVDNIREMDNGSKDLQNALSNYALVLSNNGLNNKKIQQQLRVLLQASGRNTLEQDQILVHLNKVNFDNPKQVSKLFWDSFNKATNTLHPGFAGEFTSQDYSTMKAEGEQMGKAYATSNADARKQILKRLLSWEDTYQQSAFDTLKKNYSEQFKQLGITTYKQLDGDKLGQLASMGVPRQALESWKARAAVVQTVTDGFKSQLPVADDVKKQIISLSDVNRVLYGITMTVAQAQEKYQQRLEDAANAGVALDKGQKLQILNGYRVQAGLKETTHLTDGFGAATKDATGAVKDSTNAQKEATHVAADYSSALALVKSAMRNPVGSTANAQSLMDAYKNAMQDAQDNILQVADDALTAQEDQEKRSLDARQKLETNALNRRQKRQRDALSNENRTMENKFSERSRIISEQAKKEQRALDAEHEAELDSLKKQQDAEDAALKSRQNKETASLVKTQNDRRKKVSEYYNAQIKFVNQEINAEQHAEQVREAIFNADQARIQRAAQMANTSIDFNVAVDTGQLDQAAKIMNDSQAQQEQWANQDTADSAQTASEKRVAQLQKEVDQYKKQRDARIKTLSDMDKAEKKQLSDKQKREQKALDQAQAAQKKALKDQQKRENNAEKDHEQRLKDALAADKRRWSNYYNNAKNNLDRTQTAQRNELSREQTQQDTALGNMQKRRKTAIDDEINVIKESIPRTKKQFQDQENTVLRVYDDYGVKIEKKGSNWSQTIANGLNNAIHAAAVSIQNDQDWSSFSKNILKHATRGVGMTVGQFMKFAQTGQLPKSWKMPKPVHDTTGSRRPTPDIPGSGTYHGGGEIGPGMGSGRAGITGGIKPNERFVLAKDREFVINDKSAAKIGHHNLQYMNKTGQLPIGGADIGTGGLAFLPSVMMGAAISAGINSGVEKIFDKNIGATAGYSVASGPFGDSGIRLTAEESANAGQVIQAGKRIGATNRDIVIALMTALQESGLHNYTTAVDHDSLGIFQQRASWGTVAQRTDPIWAATEFFKHLLSIKNRDSMGLGEAAQAVQRSAFPGAYTKWADEAREIMAVAQMIPMGGDVGQRKGDYKRVQFRGVTLDERTVRMIEAAESLGWPGGKMTLFQGSFSNSVAASAGTHSGGGAMDVSIDGMTQREQDKAVSILRKVGFAAWERHPWEGFVPHIHAIAIGDRLMSAAAAQQVEAFKHGKDGLADNGPDTWPDVRGGWSKTQPGREGLVATGRNQKVKLVRIGQHGKTRPIPETLGAVSRDWKDHENLPRATDIAAKQGTPVKAVTSGLVTKSDDMRGSNPLNSTPFGSYGRYIIVDHGNGMQTLYAHLSERDVRAGMMVRPGQMIGRVGHTGNATGDHLHLETWMNGVSVPPNKFGIPGLSVGGEIKYDNTLANLHKNERVLTAPLSAKLESGIEKIDSGPGVVYDIDMKIVGPFHSQIDFQKGVEDAMQNVEKRKGPKRVIGK